VHTQALRLSVLLTSYWDLLEPMVSPNLGVQELPVDILGDLDRPLLSLYLDERMEQMAADMTAFTARPQSRDFRRSGHTKLWMWDIYVSIIIFESSLVSQLLSSDFHRLILADNSFWRDLGPDCIS
jgi:hypothetical protein